MPRLPIVGDDDGVWGDYLNAFLEVSLDNTNVDQGERGKLKSSAVDAAGAVMNSDTSTASMSFVVDEDAMTSNSATKVPTQQSVKAYVDTSASGKVSKTGDTMTGELFLEGSHGMKVNHPSSTTPSYMSSSTNGATTLANNVNPSTDNVNDNTKPKWKFYISQLSDNFGVQRVAPNNAWSGGNVITLFSVSNTGNTTSLGGITLPNTAGTASAGITFGADTNLYRSAANTLRTDDALHVVGNITTGGTVDGRDVAADGTKLDGIETGADVTDATNVAAAGAVMESDTSTASMSFVVDEDDMVSNSATKVPTQQSVKAYVDTETAGLATDSGVVHTTGNETVGGEKTFTSPLLYDAGTNGSVKIENAGSPYEGGLISLRQDASDATPQVALHAGFGLVLSDGTNSPDTFITRAGVANLAIGDARLSSVADPTDAQDAATKNYVDDFVHQGVEPGTSGIRNKYLSGWYTAMLSAKTAPVDIVIFGDSISSSLFNPSGVTDTESWGAKLANLLNRRIGITTATSGFLYAKSDNASTSMTATDGANPSSLLTYGIGGWAVELENNEYIRQESNMDGITIMYTKHALGGQLEIRDGGAGGTILDTIDTYSATTEAGHTWTSGALAWGSHNIYIKGICDSGDVAVVEACYVHSGTRDKGFRVWQASHGGWWTSIFTANPTLGIHQVQRLQPALVISACGTNDDSGNIDTRNRALIDAIQAASPSSDVALWVPFIGSTYNETDRQILIDIANDYELAYIDATVSIGAINQSGNLFAYDTIHPNHLGRTMIAYQAYQMIGGDPLNSALQEAIPKAPLANPVFTGSITGNLVGNVTGAVDLSNGASGSVKLSSVFGYPGFTLNNNAADTQPAIGFTSAAFASLMGYGTNAVILFGPGGSSSVDAGLARTAASEMTFYGSSSSNKSTVAVADPTSAAHAATKSYVDTRNHQLIAKEAGQYYSMHGVTTASTLLSMTASGVLTAHPIFLQAGSYDRISVTTTVAAVSTWRFGVYPSSPTTGMPDGQTLLLDCGTIDMNQTAGLLTATISLTIPTTGVYWVAGLVDSYTATPTAHGWTTTSGTAQTPLLGAPVGGSAATAGRHAIARTLTGVGTGSMPATYPTSSWSHNAPRISLRAA